jgi:hypothetical protein
MSAPPGRGQLAPERIVLLEERRKAAEAALWQVPSISIAAQAFLLAAGLNPMAPGWARILVGLLGTLAAIATGLVVSFQSLRLTVFTRWVNERQTESLAITDLAEDLKRDRLNPLQMRLLRLPGALEAWVAVLVAFVLADLYVLFKGL